MKLIDLVPQWINSGRSSNRACWSKRRVLRRRGAQIEGLETRALLATFNVTNVNDSGTGSLRQAILQANAASGADTILVSAPGDILLTSGQMLITGSLTITGTRSTNAVINAQKKSRIFDITTAAGNVTLNNLKLLNGRTTATGEEGGAVRSQSGGTLAISDSTLSGNSTAGNGGGSATGFLDGARGGAIYSQFGGISISRSNITGNSTEGKYSGGGAVYSYRGSITISQSVVTGNSTGAYTSPGGAVATDGGLIKIIESRISGNSTRGEFSGGGAVYSYDGGITISQSTLSQNSTRGAQASGGAVFSEIGTITVSQSTLSGNSTGGSEAGGGAIHSYGGTVTVSQSTVTQNTASATGGGIDVSGLPSMSNRFSITNSIVAGNNDSGLGPDVYRRLAAFPLFVTNSLIGRNNGTALNATVVNTPDANGNFVGGNTVATRIDPQLGSLADNGGRTQTHALLPGSLAFNRGSTSLAVDLTQSGNPVLTYDQRGPAFFRVLSGRVDMGAYESRILDGSAGADTFVLNYSGTATNGTVTVTASFNGAPITSVGTFPMQSPLTINGLGGTDSIRVIGTAAADTLSISSTSLIINGSTLYLQSIENRTLVGLAGSDVYKFDADAALGTFTLDEAGGGTDTIDFSSTTTIGLSLNLAAATSQVVHATNLSLILGSAATFENSTGGSGTDTLIGNSLSNILTGGPGNDTLNGALGSDFLFGGANNDTYLFGPASVAEADQVAENLNEGADTLNFATLTTSVVVNLGATSIQPVHLNRQLKLNSPIAFENFIGGSAADTLSGNSLNNILIGGPGDDTLNGAAGSDLLIGGANNDTYLFGAATAAEADHVTENPNEGIDLLNFAYLTTDVVLNLGSLSIQPVHLNRTLKLNSVSTIENAMGGAGHDTLLGNVLANRLTGGNGNNILVGFEGADILVAGNGRDILIGGLGLDVLNGGAGDDILIAGRTTSDTSLSNLNALRTQWISGNAYGTRVTNLRAGVGSPLVSLKAKINVLNDAGEDDVMVGGGNPDWFFRALDDVITDLVGGELIDVL